MTDPIYDVKVVHPLATDDSNDSSLSGTPTDSSPSSPPMPSMDEVTTIFVVGFPDDMQEREFQNMFIFSKGFEAASLKWHSKDQQEEQESLFSSLNNKKQMIGFARFKTRQEASDAAKEMNGKKVDVEKGCVLKAEMAKKNLHIKRNSIVPNPNSMLPAAVPLPEPMTSPMMRRLSQQPDIAFSPPQPGGFSPLPSDLLSPGDYKTDPFLNDPFLIAPNTPTISESLFGSHSPSIDIRHSVDMPVNPFNLFSKSFNSDYETDPFNYLSKSSPSSKNDFPFKKTNDFPRKNSLQPHSERSASISLGTFRNNTDQNPPCNTLYVGNLPPASNEDELRSLFSSCEGYKRMSFRQKPQGPMCFVEFEDVVFATQAMSQLQGHVLSNSVKGGIRLSFSKNPLFIKPNKETELSLGFKQMGTALLADV